MHVTEKYKNQSEVTVMTSQPVVQPTMPAGLPQVKALRSLLAKATEAEAGADLFHSLYSSWSHSAGAVLSLCLLAGAYSHACDVITAYADLPMGVEVLVQIDRLVQLLETPIFTYLRLHLLQPARYPDLIRLSSVPCLPRNWASCVSRKYLGALDGIS